ncbi:MAG: HAMP domain-containing histidine kinase [Clostridia bacterium]|nr:HAMP domain-containing histidine kinase [Clostridia bacterium]
MKKKNINLPKGDFKSAFSLTTALTVIFLVLLFTVVQIEFMDDVFLLATKLNIADVTSRIQKLDFSDDAYKGKLSDYEAEFNVYLEIYSPRDVLIYTSQSNDTIYQGSSENGGELKPRIMKILSRTENEDGSYYEIRREMYASAEYLVYGCFFGDDMAMEVYYSVDVIIENAETASIALAVLTFLVVVVIFSFITFISNMFSLPLRQIKNTTKNMAELDFSEKCQNYRIKDIDELSASINTLSDKLSKTLDALKDENRKLEYDIQAEKKQDKARRSFIANVSHELKTPIAIIQGYAEGMKLGIGCDSTEEFCDIIIDESQKMNNLIMRLMEYMHFSSGAYKANRSVFNIRELISEILEGRAISLKEKNAAVIIEIDPSFVGFSDTILVENIFNNYLSNALSHLDFERVIRVTAKDMGGSYRVSVFNSGKHIPGTDIENIWQGFYRADKSHSRAEGRFGLGLSFVATMQDIMNEKYGCENVAGGVNFWFDIMKN